jgi:hypothetical protein
MRTSLAVGGAVVIVYVVIITMGSMVLFQRLHLRFYHSGEIDASDSVAAGIAAVAEFRHVRKERKRHMLGAVTANGFTLIGVAAVHFIASVVIISLTPFVVAAALWLLMVGFFLASTADRNLDDYAAKACCFRYVIGVFLTSVGLFGAMACLADPDGVRWAAGASCSFAALPPLLSLVSSWNMEQAGLRFTSSWMLWEILMTIGLGVVNEVPFYTSVFVPGAVCMCGMWAWCRRSSVNMHPTETFW